MTMLAKTTETRAMTLADYEARIHLYKEQIGTGYIGIGRTLNEAKAAQVVPHGQWESWVTETTGLTARQAQRCMQAATEIKDGSALARLEMSKALMLLGSGLDEEAREEIAEKAAEEGATVKELREQLRQAKLQIVQETGASMEIRDALRKAEADREQMEGQLRAAERGYRERLDQAREDAYKRGEMAGGADAAAEIRQLQGQLKEKEADRHQARCELSKQTQAYERQKRRIDELKGQMDEEREQAYRAGLRAGKPMDYDALKQNHADLLAAAEEAEKRAADAEAELEALRAGADYGRKPMGVQLGNAVGEFMRECSSMPFFGEELQKDRGAVISHLSNLESWIDEMYAAIGMPAVDGEGAVE
jgi:hypothetical protein